MTNKRCYYEVLEIERSATETQISEAYRRMAMKFHPDRNPGDEAAVEKFKEAAEAYEVLSNQEKRQIYDRYGHSGIDGRANGAPHFRDVGDIFDAFGDLFGDLFGFGRGGGHRVRRGADIRCAVDIDLFEAAKGTCKSVKFERAVQCPTCEGTGAKPGTSPETCSYCRGQGQVVQSAGFFSMQTTCPSCRGSGQIIREKCGNCRGEGYVMEKVTRDVTVPSGVDDGMRLRIPGEGHPSFDGGPAGDCYCSIRVKPHPLFTRKGQHLIAQVPITYAQAALGATIEVPTLDGTEDVKIAAGTQSDGVIVLRGRGMPSPHHRGRGDLHVQLHIDVPKKLSPDHEAALRKLAEVEHVDVSPKRKSFLDKLKDLLSFEFWRDLWKRLIGSRISRYVGRTYRPIR